MADALKRMTAEQLSTKQGQNFLTYEQASEYTEIPEGELRKARAGGSLVPDAQVHTGQRGRPALLFRKGTLNDFAKRYRAAQKAAKAEKEAAKAAEAPAVDTTDID